MRVLVVICFLVISFLSYTSETELDLSKIEKININGIFVEKFDENIAIISNIIITNSVDRPTVIVSSKISSEYNEQKLIDQRRDTCWAFRGGRAWVIVGGKFAPILYLLNGLWANKQLYYANNRPKKVIYKEYTIVELTKKAIKKYKYYKTADMEINLPDRMVPMTFYVAKEPKESLKKVENKHQRNGFTVRYHFYHRLDILSVYKGSIYDDTCISHLGNYKFYTDIEYDQFIKRLTGKTMNYCVKTN